MVELIGSFHISSQWACCSTFKYLASACFSSCSILQKPSTFPSSTCIDLLRSNFMCYIGFFHVCYMCSSRGFRLSNCNEAIKLWQEMFSPLVQNISLLSMIRGIIYLLICWPFHIQSVRSKRRRYKGKKANTFNTWVTSTRSYEAEDCKW